MYQAMKFKPPGVPVTAGEPGYNEYGVPLSRCNGQEQDEHCWQRLRSRVNSHCYFDTSGTLRNTDGSRSIFDDVDE